MMTKPTVTFQNPGVIDLRAVKTFGVSVKEGANPIGFFGTGLKYALAILLRTGHSVELYRGLDRHVFGVLDIEIRGEPFQIVTLDGEELGLTTAVGKTWQVWQAFRELYCNTLDENGEAFGDKVAPKAGHTTLVVTGRTFSDQFDRIGDVILQSTPLHVCGPLEIHAGRSSSVFYRGVRVSDLSRPSIYTYNLTRKVDLTEDRTMKYSFQIDQQIADGFLLCENANVLSEVLAPVPATFESSLVFNFSHETPGETFLAVMQRLRNEAVENLNQSAKALHSQHTGADDDFEEARILPVEAQQIQHAKWFLSAIGLDGSRYEVKVADSLGPNVLGRALTKRREIWLSRTCLMQGQRMTTGTLLEEYLHLSNGLKDESRAMQNFLLDLAVTFGERWLESASHARATQPQAAE